MAAPSSFSLYTCEVCLENMLDKNPRLLSCHHSFCTDCLSKLSKEGAVLCPVCRQETPVPNNNVNMLTGNFMLQQVKEHIEEMHSSQTIVCQLCLSEKAALNCQECVQFLCEDCKFQHDSIRSFREHRILQLCPKHNGRIVTHVCLKCILPACVKCVIKDHQGCENDVKAYEEGIAELSFKIQQYEREDASTNTFGDPHCITATKSVSLNVKDVDCPEGGGWHNLVNISNCDSESVLVSDWCKDYITVAYNSNKSPVTIPAIHGIVRDAFVYQGHMYTAYDNFITRRTFNNGLPGPEVRLQPHFETIYSMVIHDSCAYLLNSQENKIVEFNLKTSRTRTVVSNLQHAYNLSLIKNKDSPMFCVSCHGTQSVNVYDAIWRLKFTLGGPGGQLCVPWGTASTNDGILVADCANQTISQFDFDGKFTKHVLTSDDGLGSPLGITCNDQYLWVTQSNPYTVKCFKMSD